jgi:hypothetical protein
MSSPNGVRFGIAPQGEGESAPNTHPERGLSHLPVSSSLSSTSRRLLSTAVVRPLLSFFPNRPLHFQPLLTLVLYPGYCRCCLCFSVHLVYLHRRTAEEYDRTAEENGWVLGACAEEDSIQQTKGKPTSRYKPNQQGCLRSVGNVGAPF